jgi:aerotaxis receptor
MRQNLPITQRAYDIDDGATLMSTTDTQSRITYANASFVAVSGFSREELMGQAHNLVRHPDMPQQAFADMWSTLRDGQTWTALVKNRRKNGDHYWVRANAAPVRRDGKIVGYISVRTRPRAEEVAAADRLYRDFREGRASHLRFCKGVIVRAGMGRVLSSLQLMPLRWRVGLATTGVALASACTVLALGGLAAWPTAMAVLGGGIAATVWLEAQVVRPLARLLGQAQVIASGQAVEIPPLARVDDLGMLSRAVNQAGLNLRSLLDDVSEQIEALRSASTEIAQGNADLSARTEQSAASLQQTAASMNQMNTAVQSSAQLSAEAMQLAQGARESARSGSGAATQVDQTMARMVVGSRRIADITGLIDSIAFQTNILALNAAVEAARAGQMGRGFAVVAGEIRGLAQRCATAAGDIRSLIDTTICDVEEGSATSKAAFSRMREIEQHVTQVGAIVEQIATSTAEQSQGISQVDQAVSQLDQTTQQNAALVEQSSAAAESLRCQAQKLVEAVGAFRGQMRA